MIMFPRLFLVAGLLAFQAIARDGVDAAWKNLQSLEGEWQGTGARLVSHTPSSAAAAP
jgi:hypothetical protein